MIRLSRFVPKFRLLVRHCKRLVLFEIFCVLDLYVFIIKLRTVIVKERLDVLYKIYFFMIQHYLFAYRDCDYMFK
uniref:Uncharacterized protein n=1 Tax=Pararge aegeria TaxID=116150 RepID=S4PFY4_9NEOP